MFGDTSKIMEEQENHQAITNLKPAKDDSCGCAIGARVMAIAFLASAGFYAWEYHKGNIGLGALFLRILLVTFLGAGLGKLIGIAFYHLKKNKTPINS